MVIDFQTISITDILIAGSTLVSAIVLTITLYYQKQDRKPKFTYERVDRSDGDWMLRILHPDKPIHKISVTLDGLSLKISDVTNRYELTMRAGEGVNFTVGKDVNEESLIVIKYDNNKIKIKWKDIPCYR